MLISIIIPIFKVEPYIKRCLESVLCQTYRNLEVILVDDCTPDRSTELAKDCIEQSPLSKDLHFVYLKHDNNRGLSAARNTGMDAATGEYIFFLDSDDEITPNCIEKLAGPMSEEIYDLVVGDIQTINNDGLGDSLRLKLNDGDVLHGKAIEKTYRTHWNMMAQNKLYRKEFLLKNRLRFKEGLIHEDELWSIEVACLAQSLKAVGAITYLYYIRPGSIITTNQEARRNEALKTIVKETCHFVLEHGIFSARAYQVAQWFLKAILWDRRNNRQQFIETYIEMRESACWPLIYRIRANGWSIEHQIKNLHYYLPPKFGGRLLFYHISRKAL